MRENPNHRNFFLKGTEESEVQEEPVEETVEVVEEKAEENVVEEQKIVYPTTYSGLKALTKEEQITVLKELNVSEKDIKKLRLESQRIKKILELI